MAGKKKNSKTVRRSTSPSKVPQARKTNEGIQPLQIPSPEVMNSILNGSLEGALFPAGPFGSGAPVGQHDTLREALRWYLISNERQMISQAYVELAIFQNFVNVPVDDALAGGIDVHSEQLGEDNVKELQIELLAESTIESGPGQAEKWARTFGGGGMLVLSGQDWQMPLDINAITENEPVELRAIDMWELFGDTINPDGWDQGAGAFLAHTHYNYYGKKVHKSHVIKMLGLLAPSFIRPRLRGWGMSCLEPIVRSINQFLKSNNIDFELLDEAKIDVFMMKNLVTTLLSADGEAAVRRRVDTANRQKNYRNALVMDSEDKYEQKQITFAGLADMKKEFRIQLASDLRMPQLKLYGLSAAGLNSSSEEELEVYNSMVEGGPRRTLRPAIMTALKIKCQQKWGNVPEDLNFGYQPLRQLSAEQEQNVKTQEFNRVLAACTAGKMTDLEFREAVNKRKLLPLPLDVKVAGLDDALPEKIDPNKDPEDAPGEKGKG